MSLKLLPSKSWNVYGHKQRLRVEKDEAEEKERLEKEREQQQRYTTEARLRILRERSARLRGEEIPAEEEEEEEEEEERKEEEEQVAVRKEKKRKRRSSGTELVPKTSGRWYETGGLGLGVVRDDEWHKQREDPLAVMRFATLKTKGLQVERGLRSETKEHPERKKKKKKKKKKRKKERNK